MRMYVRLTSVHEPIDWHFEQPIRFLDVIFHYLHETHQVTSEHLLIPHSHWATFAAVNPLQSVIYLPVVHINILFILPVADIN